jgi:hypothetical protein
MAVGGGARAAEGRENRTTHPGVEVGHGDGEESRHDKLLGARQPPPASARATPAGIAQAITVTGTCFRQAVIVSDYYATAAAAAAVASHFQQPAASECGLAPCRGVVIVEVLHLEV